MQELLKQSTKEKIGKELSETELRPLLNRVAMYTAKMGMEEEQAIEQVITEATIGLKMAKEQKMREYGDLSHRAFVDGR